MLQISHISVRHRGVDSTGQDKYELSHICKLTIWDRIPHCQDSGSLLFEALIGSHNEIARMGSDLPCRPLAWEIFDLLERLKSSARGLRHREGNLGMEGIARTSFLVYVIPQEHYPTSFACRVVHLAGCRSPHLKSSPGTYIYPVNWSRGFHKIKYLRPRLSH